MGGRSSAGRASRSQCEGQGFDPPRLHHYPSNPLNCQIPLVFWEAFCACWYIKLVHKGARVARHYPHLQQRGNSFFFRRRVPDELRPIIRKLEIRETLRTSDRKHAHELVRLASVKCDALFSDARRKLRTAPVTTISETEIKHVVLNWFYAKERKAAAGARQSSDDDENADDSMLDTDDALSQLGEEEQVLQDEDHPNTLV